MLQARRIGGLIVLSAALAALAPAPGFAAPADSDKDGLTNQEEKQQYQTDPNNPDTDDDGLKDGEEVKTYQTNPRKADTDRDGLKDGREVKKLETDPLRADTDFDGLSDGDEVKTHGTSPTTYDTDGDNLDDGSEVYFNLDPTNPDTDGDGFGDNDELNVYFTDPLDPNSVPWHGTEPDTQIDSASFNGTKLEATFSSPTDPDATFQCFLLRPGSIVYADWHTCQSPVAYEMTTFPYYKPGEPVFFSVRAVDADGDVDRDPPFRYVTP